MLKRTRLQTRTSRKLGTLYTESRTIRGAPRPTLAILAAEIILFTDEPMCVDEIQFLAGFELFLADTTRKAFEVVGLIPGASHQVVGADPLAATATLLGKPPVNRQTS